MYVTDALKYKLYDTKNLWLCTTNKNPVTAPLGNLHQTKNYNRKSHLKLENILERIGFQLTPSGQLAFIPAPVRILDLCPKDEGIGCFEIFLRDLALD